MRLLDLRKYIRSLYSCRYFSYMFVHESPSHLWFNLLTQLTLAWFAHFSHDQGPSILGHVEVLIVYLAAGFGGGVAFKIVETSGKHVRLIGSSAGVFGLAGLCTLDSLSDVIQLCWQKYWQPAGHDRDGYVRTLDDSGLHMEFSRRSIFSMKSRERRLLIFASRTLSVSLLVAYDIYSYLVGDEVKRVSITVHAAGFVSGLLAGVIWRLFRMIIRLVT